MIPVGFSQAANFLTGKYIGLNRVDLAKRISSYCMNGAYTWSIASMAFVWFGQDLIRDLYTSKIDICKVMTTAWYVFTVFVFFDCMQVVVNGTISGLGLVNKVKWVTSVAYWLIGIPLSSTLMFYAGMGIEGLWYGPTVAVMVNFFYYLRTVNNADWQEIADNHAAKMEQVKEEMSGQRLLEKDQENDGSARKETEEPTANSLN